MILPGKKNVLFKWNKIWACILSKFRKNFAEKNIYEPFFDDLILSKDTKLSNKEDKELKVNPLRIYWDMSNWKQKIYFYYSSELACIS